MRGAKKFLFLCSRHRITASALVVSLTCTVGNPMQLFKSTLATMRNTTAVECVFFSGTLSSISTKTIHMKSIKIFAAFVFAFTFSLQVHAQVSPAPVVKDWERAKAYTLAYLSIMPDSGYALRPTPQMRSFAGQMLHLTDANYAFASAATGVASPYQPGEMEKTTDISKANVTRLVTAGYDFVIKALQSAPATNAQDSVKLFNRFNLTRRQVLDKAFEHQTHHRGQATVYLRLAGVTPPQEMLF